MNRKLAIALAISVALNLFLLGFMSARAMRRPDGPPRLGPSASARPDRPGPGMGPGMRKGPGMGSGPGMGRGMGPGMRKGPGPHRPGMGGPPLGRRGPGAADGGAGVAAGRVLRHAERMSDDPKVAAVLEANRERVRAQRQATRAARRAVHDALLAEPFDRAALERAFAELREQRAQAQAAAHATVVELADKLGPEERRKLARRGRGDGRRRGRMPMDE
ncbi:MAG: periplasmic heavy metal sensor [Myxococcales bacterium]|jgi:uncharacterized membrane protein